jgi:hypothetical protein
MKHFLLSVLFLLASTFGSSGKLFAHIEKTLFLSGQVGQRAIGVKMLVYDDMPERHIQYFFLNSKKDKHLLGKPTGDSWLFQSDDQGGTGRANPEVTLRLVEDKGNWNGIWTDSAGLSSNVVLSVIPNSFSTKFGRLRYIEELDPYDRYKLSDITFQKSKTEKFKGDLVSDWYIEKLSGISFFRLRSPAKNINTDAINEVAESLHLSIIREYFRFNPDGKETIVNPKILFLTNELVSFSINSKVSLKSSKAAEGRQLSTYDLKTGEPVNLENLVWFDKNTAPLSDLTNMDELYKYRKKVFGPQLLQILTELYPDKMKSDTCDLNKVETWHLPAWALTKKGIAFGFFTLDDCDTFNWAIVPYRKLKPFLLPFYKVAKK